MAKSTRKKNQLDAKTEASVKTNAFTNEARDRYYGKRVGDRVRLGDMKQDSVYGTVTEYDFMDNNRVLVLWDGASEKTPEVAEWLTIVQKIEDIQAGAEILTIENYKKIKAYAAPHSEKEIEDYKKSIQPDSVPTNTAGQLPAQPVVTQEIVTARFKAELSKIQYEAALQRFADFTITEENMADAQEKLKKARGFLRKMDEIKSAGKEPALREGRYWDNAFNDIKKVLEELLSQKQLTLNTIAQEQSRKAEIARKEEQRKADINTDIDNTIMNLSQRIAGSKTDNDLVAIQKEMGSLKANKSRWKEFIDNFIERCNRLNPLINSQKDAIRELRELEEKRKFAEQKGDDATLIAIEDKKELLNANIEEQQVLVQEEAIRQATQPGAVEIARPVFNTVKARRSKWIGELKTDDKNMKAAFNAGLLTCTLNKEKVQLLIDTLEQTKQLDGLETFEINGIKLVLEVRY